MSADPQDFYTRRVPAQWNKTLNEQEAGSVREAMEAVDATIRVIVRGDAEETFHLDIAKGIMTAHDEAAQEHTSRLLVLRIGPDVADLGIRHADDLAGVGGVGQDLLVAGHPGVEDDFARALALRPERLTTKYGSVGQRQVGAHRHRAGS